MQRAQVGMEAADVSRQGGSCVLGSNAGISLGIAIHFRVEWSTWPEIASFPCMESQHIFALPWPLSRGGQVSPWFNTLFEEWHFCWPPAPFLSLLHQCRSQSTSLISQCDFVVYILFKLSFWGRAHPCSAVSLGYPKCCLMPFLGFEMQHKVQKTRVCSG